MKRFNDERSQDAYLSVRKYILFRSATIIASLLRWDKFADTTIIAAVVLAITLNRRAHTRTGPGLWTFHKQCQSLCTLLPYAVALLQRQYVHGLLFFYAMLIIDAFLLLPFSLISWTVFSISRNSRTIHHDSNDSSGIFGNLCNKMKHLNIRSIQCIN